jgi:hypothetical protein
LKRILVLLSQFFRKLNEQLIAFLINKISEFPIRADVIGLNLLLSLVFELFLRAKDYPLRHGQIPSLADFFAG